MRHVATEARAGAMGLAIGVVSFGKRRCLHLRGVSHLLWRRIEMFRGEAEQESICVGKSFVYHCVSLSTSFV